MHFFAAVLCSVTQRFSMWGGNFSDDTIIGWARRELMQPFCLVRQRSFPSRDKTKIAEMESDLLAMLIKGDYSFRGTSSLLGYHKYH